MRYTVQSGMSHNWRDHFTENLRYILPLAAILVFAVLLGIRQSAPNQTQHKPLTLGIYTIKSSSNSGNSDKNNTASKSPASPGANQSATPSQQSFIGQTGPQQASPILSGGSSSALGGMGGGSVPSGSTGTPPTGGGGTSVGGGTIVCSNLGSLSAQLCSACTPPLLLQPGQKALLSADGTCVSVN